MNSACRIENAEWRRNAAGKWLRNRRVVVASNRSLVLRLLLSLHCAFCMLNSTNASAQQLLDRIVALVNGEPITLTDLQAARALGVVEGSTDDEARTRMVDRHLMLAEVSRFPPPEPDAAAIDAQAARARSAAGARLAAILEQTGVDDTRVRQLARDTLRIRAYIDQRFGTAVQVTDEEAETYYLSHPAEFTRNGVAIPLDQAIATARERASAERRQAQVDRWLEDLRNRADVAIPKR
jgi:hypothetical protein